MRNAASRDANKTASGQHQNSHANCQMADDVHDMQYLHEESTLPLCLHNMTMSSGEEDDDDADISKTPTATDAGDDEEDSCSSFNLEECLNEFRSRRLRRESTNSRDVGAGDVDCTESGKKPNDFADTADEDLINQNRCNKEQERKCKPCQNGFCYCFTSDSGDGGGGGCHEATRAAHVRSARRHRKSESNQTHAAAQKQAPSKPKEKRRQSDPEHLKTPVKKSENAQNATASRAAGAEQLTAISRLETSSKNAPLIHIIQELHNNCVISEVRVNKDKIQAQQQQQQNTTRSFSSTIEKPVKTVNSPKKKLQYSAELQLNGKGEKHPSPTAPPLDKISEIDSQFEEDFIVTSPLNSSGRSEDSARRRHKYGGRLLQKRLSRSQIEYRPRDAAQPPPKPPRTASQFDQKSSVSSLASTTTSVQEAERILDEFLLRKGIRVAETGNDGRTQRSQRKIETTRKSYPSIRPSTKCYTLPTCPSLADLRRAEQSNNNNNKNHSVYEKNLRNAQDKAVKELSFGWKEPKISDMLNYDNNSNNNHNRKEFKSQECQAEPQSLGWHMASGRDAAKSNSPQIGWQIPPKIDLDTVDCGLRSNLASNISNKNTPVKSRLFSAKKPNASQKFIWGEQLRNLSPWTSSKKKKTATKTTAKNRGFLNNSKRKILRLVSPKKCNPNDEEEKPLRCSVGVQTTDDGWSRPIDGPQSPPGSYHSAVQTSQLSNASSQNTDQRTPRFDFTRTVQSPPQPKKTQSRSTQRKLNFPTNCAAAMCDAADTSAFDDGVSHLVVESSEPSPMSKSTSAMTKTYRSFHSDLDQDVTLSKMGYILSNIRAKLEASDEHAVRTFQEIERREQNAQNFDCTDGPNNIRAQTRVDVHPRVRREIIEDLHNDPIYSEIEEDSIHISSRPHFENTTAAPVKQKHPEVLYATVNKKAKTPVKQTTTQRTPPTALGKILHDSLKKSNFICPPLPAEPKSCQSDAVSYTTPAPSLGQCQSLNNIRVLEHHSPPKRKNLSKSDLSLQRSEIFLENLCCSEIVVDAVDDDGTSNTAEYLQKIENGQSSYVSYADTPDGDGQTSSGLMVTSEDDSVSYEMPNDHEDTDSNTAGSHLGISHIQAVDAANHSTPKKLPETFTTKPTSEQPTQRQAHHVIGSNERLSCPSTPHHPATPKMESGKLHAVSLNEMSSSRLDGGNTNDFNSSSWTRYKKLKNALQKSFRKSKQFVKTETKRLSSSLSFPQQLQQHSNSSSGHSSNPNSSPGGGGGVETSTSTFNLESLFAVDDHTPIDVQIARAVSVCRQLPDLEISAEMVEAERLLLFSSLRRRRLRHAVERRASPVRGHDVSRRFFIDSMRLPIKADVHQDVFFNYFYICTFECNGVISSTQSVECHDHVTIFRDCGIEFECREAMGKDDGWDLTQAVIQCQIFMLRLRKVSTLSLEPRKPIVKLPTSGSSLSSLSSSGEDIVSRFKLHATFTIKAHNFAPFEYVAHESLNSGRICLRASRDFRIDLEARYKSTNLSNQIEISGRADVRLPNRSHCGFLNVQDPYSAHNWNRRWCTLDALKLSVWQDVNDMKDHPLLTLDLRDNMQCNSGAIVAAPRELCARPRSFCLQCVISKADERVDSAAVFFAADTPSDLSTWLNQINDALAFIHIWME